MHLAHRDRRNSKVAAMLLNIRKRGRHSQRKEKQAANALFGWLHLPAWMAAAFLCALPAHALVQPSPFRPPLTFQYQPTARDVDPGIDHGNSGATLPEEFQKRMVFYRSQQLPGTVIIYTRERHLY